MCSWDRILFIYSPDHVRAQCRIHGGRGGPSSMVTHTHLSAETSTQKSQAETESNRLQIGARSCALGGVVIGWISIQPLVAPQAAHDIQCTHTHVNGMGLSPLNAGAHGRRRGTASETMMSSAPPCTERHRCVRPSLSRAFLSCLLYSGGKSVTVRRTLMLSAPSREQR